MILSLMKHDIAWKAAPYAMSVSFAGGVMFGSHEIPAAFSSTFFIFIAAFVTVAQQARTSFLAPFPIKASDIYAAHVLSMGALIWFSVAAAAPWIRGVETPALAAVATFAILILQTVGIRRRAFPAWGLVVILPLLTTGDLLRVLRPGWLEGARGGWIVGLCLASSAALFMWRWSTVPEALEMAPRTRRRRAPRAVASRPSPWPWLFLRRIYLWQYVIWIAVAFLQSAGSVLYGVFSFGFAILAAAQNNRWLFALPVSRRRLLGLLVAPLLLVSLAGSVPFRFIHPPIAREVRRKGCNAPDIPVNLRFWRRAASARADVVRAPWGETFEPPLVSFPGNRAWNPYATGCQNSFRFYRWQLARAEEAVRTAQMDWREVFLDCALLAFGAFLMVCASLFASWRRAQRWFGWTRTIPLIAAMLMLAAATGVPWWRPSMVWNADNAATLLDWKLPGAWVFTALLPAALAYLTADKLFREAEFGNSRGTPAAD